MITNRKELKECLRYESKYYISSKFVKRIKQSIFKNEKTIIWKYIKLLRKSEYYYNSGKKLRYFFTNYKKDKYGLQYGLLIPINTCKKGLWIHHSNVTINGNVKIGENCQFHGNNCIGNKGFGRDDEYPTIGDNIDIGYGAVVIGKVHLGNNINIGANAVVVKSFGENDVTIVGNPGKITKKAEIQLRNRRIK